jgi:hypothetical protein
LSTIYPSLPAGRFLDEASALYRRRTTKRWQSTSGTRRPCELSNPDDSPGFAKAQADSVSEVPPADDEYRTVAAPGPRA